MTENKTISRLIWSKWKQQRKPIRSVFYWWFFLWRKKHWCQAKMFVDTIDYTFLLNPTSWVTVRQFADIILSRNRSCRIRSRLITSLWSKQFCQTIKPLVIDHDSISSRAIGQITASCSTHSGLETYWAKNIDWLLLARGSSEISRQAAAI